MSDFLAICTTLAAGFSDEYHAKFSSEGFLPGVSAIVVAVYSLEAVVTIVNPCSIITAIINTDISGVNLLALVIPNIFSPH